MFNIKLKALPIKKEYQKEFAKLQLVESSKRVLIMLLGISSFSGLLLILEILNFIPFLFQVLILQLFTIIICMTLFCFIYHFLNKKKLVALSFAVKTIQILAIIITCVYAISLSNILGYPSYSGYFIGTFILAFSFSGKPLNTVLMYIISYGLLTVYYIVLFQGHPLTAEVSNSTMLIILMGLVALFRYNQSVRLFMHEVNIRQINSKLYTQSITDELTKLYNRRKGNSALNLELKKAQRYGHALSICIIDIDNFKLVNDNFGHTNGDVVLKELSSLLLNSLRSTDILSRWVVRNL